jgi:histidinol-phosphate aminotransferase
MHSAEAIESFLDRVPERVLVVLDEAYCEYMDGEGNPDGLALLPRFPNLIVTRTFSKAWGLAALRVGYSVSSPEIANILNRVRQPFNVDSLAQVAAAAVLEDKGYLERSRQVNRDGMAQLEDGFRKLGLEWIPSAGNFLAVDVGEQAAAVNQSLLEQGVIVRPVGGYGMPRHLRISIGLPEENRRCLEALERALTDRPSGA